MPTLPLIPGTLIPVQEHVAAQDGSLPGSKRLSSPVVWGLLTVILLCQIAFCLVASTKSLQGAVDFRAFWTAGRIFAEHHGERLYDLAFQQQTQAAWFHGGRTLPFLYPPFMAALFVPLAALSYQHAFLADLLLNLALLMGSLFLLRGAVQASTHFPPISISPGLTLLASACLFPVSMALMQGQITFFLLLVCSGTLLLCIQGRPWLAGLVFAAALAKFQIALPVFVLFLLWRKLRFCTGFLAGATSLLGLSLLCCGPAGLRGFLAEIHGVASTSLADPAAAHVRFGMFAGDMPNLHGLLVTLTHGSTLGTGLSLVLSCGLVLWCATRPPSFPMALLAAMLVSYHMQAYDLVLLVVPLVALLPAMASSTGGRICWRAHRLLLAGLLPLVLPLAPLLLLAKLSCLMILSTLAILRSTARLTPEPWAQPTPIREALFAS